MAFSDWSTTAAANTTIGGIDIGEGCPPSNLNNAIREEMAELRAAFNIALDSFFASGSLADARTALGALGAAGGTVTGNFTRSGGGSHLYYTDAAYASGRVFHRAAADADPSSLAGDLVLTLA